jgi:hypothetical protein
MPAGSVMSWGRFGMTEFLSEILSLTVTVAIVGFFVLIGFVVVMAIWMAVIGGRQRRPDCYKKHDFKPHNAVLFDCALCPYERECWK